MEAGEPGCKGEARFGVAGSSVNANALEKHAQEQRAHKEMDARERLAIQLRHNVEDDKVATRETVVHRWERWNAIGTLHELDDADGGVQLRLAEEAGNIFPFVWDSQGFQPRGALGGSPATQPARPAREANSCSPHHKF